jgi:hypothetical protein
MISHELTLEAQLADAQRALSDVRKALSASKKARRDAVERRKSWCERLVEDDLCIIMIRKYELIDLIGNC